MTHELIAEWDGQVYTVAAPDGNTWVSADGDEWFFDVVGGERVQGSPFEGACIALAGGPRAGEVVA